MAHVLGDRGVDGQLDVTIPSISYTFARAFAGNPGMVVADVIPNPPRTHLVQDAESRGCRVIDGLGMLVNQGVIGIKIAVYVNRDNCKRMVVARCDSGGGSRGAVDVVGWRRLAV